MLKNAVRLKLCVLLLAALSFVAFSQAHVTRAVDVADMAVSGLFAPGDICGDVGGEGGRDCPSCLLAASLLVADAFDVSAPEAWHKRALPPRRTFQLAGVAYRVYHARAPPVFS